MRRGIRRTTEKMQKNIKKTLIIIPIMLALCFSFIGIKSYVTKYYLNNQGMLISR